MGPSESLRKIGYAVFPSLYSEAFLARARREVIRLYEKAGSPHLTQRGKSEFAQVHGVRSGAGLMIGQLLHQAPDLIQDYFHPVIVDVFRDVLGTGLHLDATGACIADEHRNPVLSWHNHLGGVDSDVRQPNALDPLGHQRIRRLVMLIYLDGLSEERGALIVHPRELSDPLDCPSDDEHCVEIEGNAVITGPPGTTVLLEERCWHAAFAPTVQGFRRFVGAMVAANWAPPAQNREPMIPGLANSVFTQDP